LAGRGQAWLGGVGSGTVRQAKAWHGLVWNDKNSPDPVPSRGGLR